jgi:hypothetical protein
MTIGMTAFEQSPLAQRVIAMTSCQNYTLGGQWSVVSGQWSVVSGQWSVVSVRDDKRA